MKSIASVWICNVSTIAVINLASIKDLATLLLTVLSIAFTIHQWRREKKDDK